MMSSRRAHRWAALAALVAIGLTAQIDPAHANEDRLRDMNRRGMEAYDLLEYEEARQILSDAIVFAKRNRLGDAPLTARVHLNLGIIFFSGLQDENAAAIEFVNALEIDPAIQIPAAYRTPAMQALLDEIRADLGGSPQAGGCGQVTGLQHALIEEAAAGQPRAVGAQVGQELRAQRVVLYYRDQSTATYSEVVMGEAGDCAYRGQIPGHDVAGEYIYYYIAAMRGGRVVASSGSAGTPNIIEVRAEARVTENPLTGVPPRSTETSAGGTASASANEASIFLLLALGSGGGYVTGHTEQRKDQVACCFAPALFHVLPEVGFFLNPQTSLSVAFRMGFPLGADLPGHAAAAPGGYARLRYATSETGVGPALSFLLGGGVMRNTVPLAEPVQGGTTDTVASGPLLAGAGVGYAFALGDTFRFVTELNAIAGIPVVSCLGDCGPAGRGVEPNFAVQFDANVGVMISF
jgi:hypothetical protein